ncbi:PepSY-associated TM helix domain-containing protein [Niveispirillum sp. KHB5.9]|uniref:PepSY-associated TM helix domain-containing protein n=1 Tax=Niveispirillum sp. KHB5.9 TaxID=3400269 RepID=UPI003A89263A
MKNNLRQSMAWLHTWAGLLAGWILFAMFLTGTASYFRPEITAWMQPELTRAADPDRATLAALDHLAGAAPDARQWTVMVPDGRTAGIHAFWRDAAGTFGDVTLDGATGAPAVVRETRGGEFFYRFHFQLQLPRPWGRWLAGACAMMMLAAIISGVITHKRIFADFFTFRPRKGQRSWLDAHNVMAVLALPFHAMITYTGLVTLVVLYMPWGIMANYPNPDDYQRETFRDPVPGEAAGVKAPLADIGPLLRDARRQWQGAGIGRVVVFHPGDAAASIALYRDGGGQLGVWNAPLVYGGTDGRLITNPGPAGPAVTTGSVMVGLHVGWFAGPVLRWLYFLSGLMGTAMVGTGLVLWAVKRRTPMPVSGKLPLGQRLVEILNIGTITGLPAGMACFFLANRLLPADLAGRAGMEVAATFWVWGLMHLPALLRPARRAWVEGFGIAGLVYLLLPLVDLATNFRHLAVGDGLMASFDLAFLAIGGGLLLIAGTLHRREQMRK